VSKRRLRKSINVVLQNPYINENETIRNNLLGLCSIEASDPKNDIPDSKLRDVLERASLQDIDLYDRASTLSGGQVQLLSMAKAMLNSNKASILLLDEPTSHIDPES